MTVTKTKGNFLKTQVACFMKMLTTNDKSTIKIVREMVGLAKIVTSEGTMLSYLVKKGCKEMTKRAFISLFLVLALKFCYICSTNLIKIFLIIKRHVYM